jgi:glutamine cyclotransferase
MLVYCTTVFKPVLLLQAVKMAQADLSRQALADCNRYCKVDSGKLKASSLTASDLQRGRLIWKSDYARSAYYSEGANRDKNPLAGKMWAHKAALLNRKRWRAFAAVKLKEHLSSGFSRKAALQQTSEVS